MDVGELGPFFALQDLSDDGDWRPLRALRDGPDLAERVEHARSFLGAMTGTEVEPRVAASTVSLGLFARLVAPVLGARVLRLTLPRPGLDDVHWQPVAGGPWPLALTGEEAEPDLRRTVEDVVLPLVATIAERYALSTQVLRGNVASGVFGAVRMIGEARADLRAAAGGIAAELLAGPLAGTGTFDGGFVRSSCCLYYRVGGYCADCVLVER